MTRGFGIAEAAGCWSGNASVAVHGELAIVESHVDAMV